MLRVLVGNALLPSGARSPRRLPVRDLVWFRLAGLSHVAVDTYWDRELPVLRRSRPHFLRLGAQAIGTLLRAGAGIGPARAAWRAALPRLSSRPFWIGYLGLGDAEERPEGVKASPPAA